MNRNDEFTLEEFMAQLDQVKKLGSMEKIMDQIPGKAELKFTGDEVERHMAQLRAIYDSMTKRERAKPDSLDDNRRQRVSRGAGVEPAAIDQFFKQFEQTRDMMKRVGWFRRGRLNEGW